MTQILKRVGCLVLLLVLASCGEDQVTSATEAPVAASDELTEVLPEASIVESEPSSTTTTAATETTNTTEAAQAAEAESTTTSSTTTTTIATTTTTTTEAPSISDAPLAQVNLELELIARLTSPVGIAPRPGSNDLFVIEQRGRVVRLPNGAADGADTTLDVSQEATSSGNEQGLLGIAFSPDGNTLYVNYTSQPNGSTTIARYDMVGTTADRSSAEILLEIPQPRANHNGGGLAFGPDGHLYIGMGDGGGGGDPFRNGQNPNTLHGAVLRIDVDTSEGYRIPADNPFPNGGAPEVFVWGIRNAWRFGFDSATGDLWVGDVGQDRFEEVTVLRAANGGGNGANLGWNEVEGPEVFRGGTVPAGHVAPAITYGHSNGRCSLTSGEVYRGDAIPGLRGTFLYGDLCSGEVFGYRVDGSAAPVRLQLPAIDQPSSFGLDNAGEAYVLSRSGGVFRITG